MSKPDDSLCQLYASDLNVKKCKTTQKSNQISFCSISISSVNWFFWLLIHCQNGYIVGWSRYIVSVCTHSIEPFKLVRFNIVTRIDFGCDLYLGIALLVNQTNRMTIVFKRSGQEHYIQLSNHQRVIGWMKLQSITPTRSVRVLSLVQTVDILGVDSVIAEWTWTIQPLLLHIR